MRVLVGGEAITDVGVLAAAGRGGRIPRLVISDVLERAVRTEEHDFRAGQGALVILGRIRRHADES